MPLRILFVGVTTKNPNINTVPFLSNAPSLFDYDIVLTDVDSVFDPHWRREIPIDDYIIDVDNFLALLVRFNKRSKEFMLLMEKGGILICLLRPQRGFGYTNRTDKPEDFVSNYDWIPIQNLRMQVTSGSGQRINLCADPGPFTHYLKMNDTYWTAYFEDIDKLSNKKRIFALNDAGKPIAVEFAIGKGSLFFIPLSNHKNIGDILLTYAKHAFKKTKERPPPSWMETITVPGEDTAQKTVKTLTEKRLELEAEYKAKISIFKEITQIKKLLYEKDEPLEEAVKKAFEELGFTLTRKDDKDWIASSDIGEVILEVTGSDGSINIKKLRQLLDYFTEDSTESDVDKKAILVGNHFANDPPEIREAPFTEKVLKQSEIFSMCLLPTLELFKVICHLREGKVNAIDIRKQIMETIGIFELS